MKLYRLNALAPIAAAAMLALTSVRASADTSFTVDPGHAWLGFMNVFELPANGGGYVFGSGWGTADLTATFAGPVLTLGPNCVNDPNPFWYIGGGGPGAPGNKIMEANMYVEHTGTLQGQNVTFEGTVLSKTFTSAHNTIAFIKDFAPDYSSFTQTTIPLSATGAFSITHATLNDAARHVQFGFQTVGVNVWVTDLGPFGNLQVTAIPEPATLGALGAASVLVLSRRRRQA